jgi:hypothetical protein
MRDRDYPNGPLSPPDVLEKTVNFRSC